jgi:hypothetical protein
MQPKMGQFLPGTFRTRELGKGAWRLSRSGPDPIDVFVRGADSQSAEVLRGTFIRDLGLEWFGDAVTLSLQSAAQSHNLRMQNAIVHEPLPRLYEALPLAALDAKARHFWRRVFRLVRVPGGRYLLAFLARRSRDSS